VGLARILATQPKLIVADEPTSGLDAAIKLQTIALLQELKGAELTYLLISHDLGLVRRIADRVLVMLRGRIIEECPVSELGERAHHPYTEKLLAAAQLGDRPLEHDTASIEDLTESAEGCAYASLCSVSRDPELTERCLTARPPLIQIESPHETGGGAIACFAHGRLRAHGESTCHPPR
jgi:ABC-type dipeptide/oligopeptide/nickel transport system ATPase component